MRSKINWVLRNLHLIISVSTVAPTALIYGSPSVLPGHLDIQVNTIDLANMLKAIMWLYLAVSFVWILGVYRPKYWKVATQLNVLFMISLAVGRTISMVMDGLPTGGYIFGVVAEYTLGFYSLYQLGKYQES